MFVQYQQCSPIASPSCRRFRAAALALIGLSTTVLVPGAATAADSPALASRSTAASCTVDVSDWPVGILPDDASAAFGPATLAACKDAVADWPMGALPDDASTLFDRPDVSSTP
jgi:hypothetical protein